MSAKSKAYLYFLLPGSTLNGSKHGDLSKEKLELHMVLHNSTVFMHNEALCHKKEFQSNFRAHPSVLLGMKQL